MGVCVGRFFLCIQAWVYWLTTCVLLHDRWEMMWGDLTVAFSPPIHTNTPPWHIYNSYSLKKYQSQGVLITPNVFTDRYCDTQSIRQVYIVKVQPLLCGSCTCTILLVTSSIVTDNVRFFCFNPSLPPFDTYGTPTYQVVVYILTVVTVCPRSCDTLSTYNPSTTTLMFTPPHPPTQASSDSSQLLLSSTT